MTFLHISYIIMSLPKHLTSAPTPPPPHQKKRGRKERGRERERERERGRVTPGEGIMYVVGDNYFI
jgi:hypothetical protein